MANVQHSQVQHANCHEPRWITISVSTDTGKVITPSATIPGTSELRFLQFSEIAGTGSVVTLTATQTLTNKRITSRSSIVPYAATISVNSDTFDLLACASLTGNVIVAAPTGTPTDNQELRIRLTQDATGGRTVTFNAIFKTVTAISATAGKTTTWTFAYNSSLSVWQEVCATAGT